MRNRWSHALDEILNLRLFQFRFEIILNFKSFQI